MRRVVAQTFLSLDAVMEAPEKWQLPNDLLGEDAGAYVYEAYNAAGALLLGRVTYEQFAAFWPNQSDDDPFAKRINELPRYVVTRTLKKLDWAGSHAISGKVTDEVRKLKEESSGDILIPGSSQLVNGLAGDGLIDEYQLLIHPIVVGKGKHLFEAGTTPTLFTVVETRTFCTGVVALVCRPRGKAVVS